MNHRAVAFGKEALPVPQASVVFPHVLLTRGAGDPSPEAILAVVAVFPTVRVPVGGLKMAFAVLFAGAPAARVHPASSHHGALSVRLPFLPPALVGVYHGA